MAKGEDKVTAIIVCVSKEAHGVLWKLKKRERQRLAEIATEILEGALKNLTFEDAKSPNCNPPSNGCKCYILFDRVGGCA